MSCLLRELEVLRGPHGGRITGVASRTTVIAGARSGYPRATTSRAATLSSLVAWPRVRGALPAGDHARRPRRAGPAAHPRDAGRAHGPRHDARAVPLGVALLPAVPDPGGRRRSG